MTQPPPRRTPHVAFAALFAIALIGYAYAPLLSSWYIADDWHFFALYRHLDSPLSFVHENPVTSYFYRPIPLLLGSGAFALFELSGTGHYLLSVALHLWVAVEIYRLAMVDAVARTKAIAPIAAIAFATALLFVLFPLNAGTVAWISNRFDLMATAASLAAIRCAFVYVRAPRAGSLSAMSAWALVACLSKESGFAAIPACAFAVLAAQRFDLRARSVYLPIACLTAVVVGVFALRFMAMGFLFPPASELPQPVGYVEGVMRWTAALWLALRENTAAAVSLGLLLIGAIFMASMARVREWSPPWLAISVLIYAAVVIIAQAPIAKAAFPENATVSVSNRFFLFNTCLAVFSRYAPRDLGRQYEEFIVGLENISPRSVHCAFNRAGSLYAWNHRRLESRHAVSP